jgi:hypothetical protein
MKNIILVILTFALVSCMSEQGADQKTITKEDTYEQIVGSKKMINAIQKNDMDTVVKYLERGVDPNYANYKPIIWAAAYNNVEMIKVLLKHGADINATTSSGETALMIGSMQGSYEAVKFLIENNADVNLVDDENKDAMDYILGGGYRKLDHKEIIIDELIDGVAKVTIELAKNGFNLVRFTEFNILKYVSLTEEQYDELDQIMLKNGFMHTEDVEEENKTEIEASVNDQSIEEEIQENDEVI